MPLNSNNINNLTNLLDDNYSELDESNLVVDDAPNQNIDDEISSDAND